ncbi:MAG TPA: hypothetical protein VMS86_05210 [Thermoanaerobaculia bacterium]|nr:hypothetical protein [Thermoanaerobaculia bacterium]
MSGGGAWRKRILEWSPPPSGTRLWILSFAIAAPLLALFFTRNPLLYDNDAYYHLAIARAYFEEGLIDELRWARFSAMAEGFGDKEVLFHLLLAPFAGLAADPVRGGQLALALLLAALFATLAAATRPALGAWSVLLPWWLAFASTELAWRWVRLRPELLSLLLLILALSAIGRRRWRLLGVVAAVYALSYTAFHAFLGLCVAVFLFTGWARRRWEWGLLAYSAAGTGLGLVVHPHFPKNLEIWVLQTLEYFRQRGSLDVGTEISPNYTDVTLMVNLGWALGILVLWLSSRRPQTAPGADATAAEATGARGTGSAGAGRHRDDQATRLADAFGVAAAAFTLLYLLMSRFSLYAIPFATLWALHALRARGLEIGGWTRLPWSRARVPLAVAAAVCLAVSFPEARRPWVNHDLRTQAGPDRARLRDREAFAAALPVGARVAAPWQQTPVYMLWAPQGRYLNVLDPVFLAARDPVRHAVQERVFAGLEPDVPLAVAGPLASGHLAYSPYAGLDLLTARLEPDPRVALRHRLHGFNLLWEMIPNRNAAFLLDWRLPPPDQVETLRSGPRVGQGSPTAAIEDLRLYPRLPPGRGREIEAYVDTRRVDDGSGCVTLVHPISIPESMRWQLELAPWGPSTAWLDGEPIAEIAGEPQAVLGRGVTFPLQLEAGEHLLAIHTCPGKDARGPRGFYLRRLGRGADVEAP